MTVTNYIWDEVSDNVLLETDGEGAVTAQYTQEPGLYGPVVSQDRDGDTSFYHFDGQGSTRQLTDESETVTDEATYSAFGTDVAESGSTVNPWGYKGAMGYYANSGTSERCVRARYLATLLGRWLSVDPLGWADGINRYVYSRNSPAVRVDPSGKKCTYVGPSRPNEWELIDVFGGGIKASINFNPGTVNHEPTSELVCKFSRTHLHVYKCRCCRPKPRGKKRPAPATYRIAYKVKEDSSPVPVSMGTNFVYIVGVAVFSISKFNYALYYYKIEKADLPKARGECLSKARTPGFRIRVAKKSKPPAQLDCNTVSAGLEEP